MNPGDCWAGWDLVPLLLRDIIHRCLQVRAQGHRWTSGIVIHELNCSQWLGRTCDQRRQLHSFRLLETFFFAKQWNSYCLSCQIHYLPITWFHPSWACCSPKQRRTIEICHSWYCSLRSSLFSPGLAWWLWIGPTCLLHWTAKSGPKWKRLLGVSIQLTTVQGFPWALLLLSCLNINFTFR